MEDNKCNVCEANFFGGPLVDGVCSNCTKLYPGVKTKEGLKKDKKPEVESQEAITKELVTKQVDSVLESYGILHRCLTCSNLYFKRSPAQKSCGCDKEVK